MKALGRIFTPMRFFLCALALLSLLTAAVIICVIIPWQEETMAHIQAASLTEATVKSLNDFRDKHGDMQSYEQKLASDVQTVDNALPENMNETQFMLELQKEISASGLRLSHFALLDKVTANGVSTLPIEMELWGNYWELLDFLESLSLSTRLVNVKKMSLKSDGDLLSCRLTIAIYAVKPTTP